jgi:hypothetical protein
MKNVSNVSKIACIEWGIFISDFLQGNIAEENSNVIFNLEEDYLIYGSLRIDRCSEDYFNELNEEQGCFHVELARIKGSVFYSARVGKNVFYNIFYARMKKITSLIASVFVAESFEDWLQEMHDTDWDYYGADPDAWIMSLMSMTNADILKVLKQYAEDNEAEAYANGFLPDNEGVDVREWSNSLYDYFGI